MRSREGRLEWELEDGKIRVSSIYMGDAKLLSGQ
jgi:hypothetical protein